MLGSARGHGAGSVHAGVQTGIVSGPGAVSGHPGKFSPLGFHTNV